MFFNLRTVNFAVVGMLVTLNAASWAQAQTVITEPIQTVQLPANVTSALLYSNNARRFFEEGKAQFEQAIHQLSAGDDDESIHPLLTLQPEVLEQFDE
ncbi:MAG: hypothetical protein AAF821_07810 [Cyanobacteria bacterium P01_D01_bin.156]